jgi:hypothetical protein
MEKTYAFIKNGVVENILVFAERDEALAQRIADEQGYDFFVWLDNATPPARWSTYDGTTFTAPTLDYLYGIGVVSENSEMQKARIAAAPVLETPAE